MAEAIEQLQARLRLAEAMRDRPIHSASELQIAKVGGNRWLTFNIDLLAGPVDSTAYAEEHRATGATPPTMFAVAGNGAPPPPI